MKNQLFALVLQGFISEHLHKFGYGPDGLILQNRTGGILRYKDAARLFRVATSGRYPPLCSLETGLSSVYCYNAVIQATLLG